MIRSALAQCSSATRQVLIAGFFFNLAFYMLIPYLAWHLRQDLLLSAAAIGLVMGVRTLSQQGLFIVGGVLADRFGIKYPIVIGCWLRVLGLVLFAVADTPALLIGAAILSGFSGALFTPAAQAYFGTQSEMQGRHMFALVSVVRSAGELLGPLLGLALISVNFFWLCIAAAVPFCLFGCLFMFSLPRYQRSAVSGGNKMLSHCSAVFSNRAFIAFCAMMSVYFILINQLSFALPLEMQRRGGGEAWLALLFSVSALLGVLLQLNITRWSEARWPPSRVLSAGIALMGIAFLCLLLDFSAAPLGVAATIDRMTVLIAATVLTVGMLAAYPVVMDQIARFSANRSTATHFGVFYLFASLGLTVGNFFIGALLDAKRSAVVPPASVWVLLFCLALLVAIGVYRRAYLYDEMPNQKEIAGDQA